MKTLKPKIKTLKNKRAIKPRPTGNTLYALMKKAGPRLCAKCLDEGSVGNGDELDHKIPLASGGSNEPSNLQWLCKRHHDEKTAADVEKWGGGV